MRRRQIALALLLFAALPAIMLRAQTAPAASAAATIASSLTTVAEISASLKDKPLYLRGQWSDNNLTFDTKGILKKTSLTKPWTECGFQVQKVELRGDRLIVEGERIAVEFDKDKLKRVSDSGGLFGRSTKIHIQIDAASPLDYAPALAAIFAPDAAALVPSLPDYWQPFARKNILGEQVAPYDYAPCLGTECSNHLAGKVTNPSIRHSVEPVFSETSHNMKFSGSVAIQLVIDTDGKPQHVIIEQAVGLGLDDNAIASVRQYTFVPAKQNGKPVEVQVTMKVNFQIFSQARDDPAVSLA